MIILDKLNVNQLNQKDKHGLIIIAIAIISRIFVVSIAWSYGIFLKALKEKYPNSYYVELGWIAGLAQGLGMIISPLYVIIAKRVGYRLTFTVGLGLCALSLFSSSFIPNEHYLFLTYSLPFGIGSGITFVLGSVVTGLYYPPKSAYHIMATVAISLGFPLGFLILNFITDSLLHLTNDWQKVQFIYSLIALVCTVAFFPFFTEKYAEYDEVENEATQEVICNEPLLFGLTKERFQYLVRFLWLSGLIVNSCANNSVLIHLNGYFKSLGFNQSELKNAFFAIGLSDAVTRILLAIKGHVVKYNLLFCYITSVAIGFLLSIFWSLQTTASFNTFYCIFFGICPAILMSLMYSVNLEIYGSGTIQKNYTINVMTSGIGIILGPIISGAVLDSSVMSYDSVFKLSYKLYFLAILLYSATKFLLMKHTQISTSEQGFQDSVGGYEELK